MTIDAVLENIARVVSDERYPPPLKVWLVNKALRLGASGPDGVLISHILADHDGPPPDAARIEP